MASVQDLIEKNCFELKNAGKTDRDITKVFCCDLLSIAMGKAPGDSAWVTVMGNRNTLAVASLADVSCVILAEGAAFAPEDLDCAKKEEITVFYTELPVFDAALAVHALL